MKIEIVSSPNPPKLQFENSNNLLVSLGELSLAHLIYLCLGDFFPRTFKIIAPELSVLSGKEFTIAVIMAIILVPMSLLKGNLPFLKVCFVKTPSCTQNRILKQETFHRKYTTLRGKLHKIRISGENLK